jgi:hypothetical protein
MNSHEPHRGSFTCPVRHSPSVRSQNFHPVFGVPLKAGRQFSIDQILKVVLDIFSCACGILA